MILGFFSQYPRSVSDIISSAIWWTIALQLPAIIVGWLLGNILGALAAYIRKGFDKVVMPACLLASSMPAFGMAVILLVIFGITMKVAPTSGAYSYTLIPNLSLEVYKICYRALPAAFLVHCDYCNWRAGYRYAFDVHI